MRIVIADDQPKVCFALRVLLERDEDLVVVGEAVDAQELQENLSNTKPDIVILDWLLPGLEQKGSFAALRQIVPGLIIIALSGRPELGPEAMEQGADAFISKIDHPEGLLNAIERFRKSTVKHSCS